MELPLGSTTFGECKLNSFMCVWNSEQTIISHTELALIGGIPWSQS